MKMKSFLWRIQHPFKILVRELIKCPKMVLSKHWDSHKFIFSVCGKQENKSFQFGFLMWRLDESWIFKLTKKQMIHSNDTQSDSIGHITSKFEINGNFFWTTKCSHGLHNCTLPRKVTRSSIKGLGHLQEVENDEIDCLCIYVGRSFRSSLYVICMVNVWPGVFVVLLKY